MSPADAPPGARPDAPGARAHLTPDVPPLPGALKAHHDDFLVEEIPLYQPAGSGEHIYLFIEKQGITTGALIDIVAKHFGVRSRDVGAAGHKDRHAITRQVLSVHAPGRTPEDFPQLVHEGVQVLWVDLHTNKLRPGHLRANRFSIRLRGVPVDGVLRARRVLETLSDTGVPNFFGPQRFGALGNNHEVARLALLGDHRRAVDAYLLGERPPDEREARWRRCYREGNLPGAIQALPRAASGERRVLDALADGADPADALRRAPAPMRRFWANALQSFVFNEVLSRRIEAGTLDTLAPGDLAWRHDNGAVFGVDEQTARDADTLRRLADKQISPSGPMWGEQMTRAGAGVDEQELDALGAAGLRPEDLARCRDALRVDAPGLRRALRVPLVDPLLEAGADERGTYLRLAFELPRGAFATSVVREITKGHEPADVSP